MATGPEPFHAPVVEALMRVMLMTVGVDMLKPYRTNGTMRVYIIPRDAAAKKSQPQLRILLMPNDRGVLSMALLTDKENPLMSVSFNGMEVEWRMNERGKQGVFPELPTDDSLCMALLYWARMRTAGTAYLRQHLNDILKGPSG